MDLDGDGLVDVISGSWPGEIYFFRRLQEGRFADAERLVHRDDTEINVGSAAAAHAVDWDNDGDLDLIVGTIDGKLHFLPREGGALWPMFGQPQPIADCEELRQGGDAAPFAADWDEDGRLDLLVGTSQGSVYFLRNEGGDELPELAAPQKVIDKGPAGTYSDDRVLPGQWGQRAKICVVDFNGDGMLDILLGDICGGFEGKPGQTENEVAEEQRAAELLPEVRRRWAAAYQHYRRDNSDQAREEMLRLKRAIENQQEILSMYRSRRQYHGYVWFFERERVRKVGGDVANVAEP